PLDPVWGVGDEHVGVEPFAVFGEAVAVVKGDVVVLVVEGHCVFSCRVACMNRRYSPSAASRPVRPCPCLVYAVQASSISACVGVYAVSWSSVSVPTAYSSSRNVLKTAPPNSR